MYRRWMSSQLKSALVLSCPPAFYLTAWDSSETLFTQRKCLHQTQHLLLFLSFDNDNDNGILASPKLQTLGKEFETVIFWDLSSVTSCVNWQTTRYIVASFGQCALHFKSKNNKQLVGGGLPNCICVDDSDEFIKALPCKCTFVATLLWSVISWSQIIYYARLVRCVNSTLSYFCLHLLPYTVQRFVQRCAVFRFAKWFIMTPSIRMDAPAFSVARVNARTARKDLSGFSIFCTNVAWQPLVQTFDP